MMERYQVQKKARDEGITVHFGRLHDICVEKHSELPNPADRKYKGRVVFGGHDIRQEDGLQVIFADGGSSASFMTAAKGLDGMALLPGCSGEQADAPSAYTQCELGAETPGVFPTTWITLPFEHWPKAWKERKAKNPKFDPVCPLRLSLYGHPMAGVFWERHCQVKLKEAGFVPVPGWECLLSIGNSNAC